MDVFFMIFSIQPFSWLNILCVIFAGAIIGLERQMQGKPIGIRTSILITLATYAFMVLARCSSSAVTDDARIVGQIIAGIGFLGAGVILARDGVVTGVTSASVIWVLAAIGITIGLGYGFVGVKLSIMAVLIIVFIEHSEKCFRSLQKGVHQKKKTN